MNTRPVSIYNFLLFCKFLSPQFSKFVQTLKCLICTCSHRFNTLCRCTEVGFDVGHTRTRPLFIPKRFLNMNLLHFFLFVYHRTTGHLIEVLLAPLHCFWLIILPMFFILKFSVFFEIYYMMNVQDVWICELKNSDGTYSLTSLSHGVPYPEKCSKWYGRWGSLKITCLVETVIQIPLILSGPVT